MVLGYLACYHTNFEVLSPAFGTVKPVCDGKYCFVVLSWCGLSVCVQVSCQPAPHHLKHNSETCCDGCGFVLMVYSPCPPHQFGAPSSYRFTASCDSDWWAAMGLLVCAHLTVTYMQPYGLACMFTLAMPHCNLHTYRHMASPSVTSTFIQPWACLYVH